MAAAEGIWKSPVAEEDTVQYFLFPKLDVLNGNEATEALAMFRETCIAALQEYIEPYIWQNEAFALHVPAKTGYLVSRENKPKENGTEKGMQLSVSLLKELVHACNVQILFPISSPLFLAYSLQV